MKPKTNLHAIAVALGYSPRRCTRTGFIPVSARLRASFTRLCRASGLRPGVYAGSREGHKHPEPGSPGFSLLGLSHPAWLKPTARKPVNGLPRAWRTLATRPKGRAYYRCAAKPRERGWEIKTCRAQLRKCPHPYPGVALGLELSVLRTENAPSYSRRRRRGGQQAA
jgi:hypothetical protein